MSTSSRPLSPQDAPGRSPAPAQRSVLVLTALCAAIMLFFGFWALVGPASFADFIDYPPYNEHLLHDLGAFQIGIGTATALALFRDDALLVALTGFAVAAGLHTVSHVIDRHEGGHGSDVPMLGLLTLAAVAAAVIRLCGGRR